MPNSSTFIVGNLAHDPELRFTSSGQAVCNLTVAVNERYFDTGTKEWADRDATFYRVNVWRQLAENCSESLNKGDRVIVIGDMRHRSYEKDGETRYTWEMEARSVGCDLAWAIARTNKAERAGEVPAKAPAKRPAKSSTRKPAKNPDPVPWDDEPPF